MRLRLHVRSEGWMCPACRCLGVCGHAGWLSPSSLLHTCTHYLHGLNRARAVSVCIETPSVYAVFLNFRKWGWSGWWKIHTHVCESVCSAFSLEFMYINNTFSNKTPYSLLVVVPREFRNVFFQPIHLILAPNRSRSQKFALM